MTAKAQERFEKLKQKVEELSENLKKKLQTCNAIKYSSFIAPKIMEIANKHHLELESAHSMLLLMLDAGWKGKRRRLSR